MIRPEPKFRYAEVSAVCALTLSLALSVSAMAQQNLAGATPTRKAAASSSHKSTSGAVHKSSSKSKRSPRKKASRIRGQQKIDSERARSIQEALIREHYLRGEPTGTWNQACEDAMRKYQADHGWQSKTVPDSRALISLGLGPSKDHLLNPESAMTTVPDPPRSDSTVPVSHAATPASTPIPASNSSADSSSSPPTSEAASPQ